jgi:hypothetical protein
LGSREERGSLEKCGAVAADGVQEGVVAGLGAFKDEAGGAPGA